MPAAHVSVALDHALGSRPVRVRDEGGLSQVRGFTRVLRDVLSPSECQLVIAAAEVAGFEPAALYTDAGGRDVFSTKRASHRAIIDSTPFATALWERLRPYVPLELAGQRAVGLNERARVLRYDPGDAFAPHCDASYRRTDGSGAESRVTVLLYLNEGYTGGRTTFYASRHAASRQDGTDVVPRIGTVALQDQALLHGVPPLVSGRKYILRTEVMYARTRTGAA